MTYIHPYLCLYIFYYTIPHFSSGSHLTPHCIQVMVVSLPSPFTHHLTLSLAQDFLDGQNCLMFSYGVTNSGKTHTIHGSQDDPGILPRVLDSVFASLGDKLYEGDQLKPKNYCEIEWLSGDRLQREKAVKDKIFSKVRKMHSTIGYRYM